jgi:hypothetical protein
MWSAQGMQAGNVPYSTAADDAGKRDQDMRGSFYVDGKINLVGMVLGLHAGIIAWMVTGDFSVGASAFVIFAAIGCGAWWLLCRDPWRRAERAKKAASGELDRAA